LLEPGGMAVTKYVGIGKWSGKRWGDQAEQEMNRKKQAAVSQPEVSVVCLRRVTAENTNTASSGGVWYNVWQRSRLPQNQALLQRSAATIGQKYG